MPITHIKPLNRERGVEVLYFKVVAPVHSVSSIRLRELVYSIQWVDFTAYVDT